MLFVLVLCVSCVCWELYTYDETFAPSFKTETRRFLFGSVSFSGRWRPMGKEEKEKIRAAVAEVILVVCV